MPKKIENIKEFTSEFGNTFKFQRVGTADWLDLMDQCEGESGKPVRGKLYPAILKNVVVEPPNLSLSDFDQEPYGAYGEVEEVVTEAIRFQRGKH